MSVLISTAWCRYALGLLAHVDLGHAIGVTGEATFIHPCQPIVAKQPPTGRGWAYKLGIGVSIVQPGLSGGKKMKNMGRHFKWRVRTQQEAVHFRVYCQHDYPHGTVETRDTRHFYSLAEAEEFAETMRRMNRIFTNLSGAEKAEVH
jgi:hypothetical protein